uniref:Ubiquitin-like domain-containing protein n=1 Tax=Dendroctonus ponderosae TaxID=77166 RepID=J3JYJ7_DENPD|nr:unknown [Dendroctonus ponderosae]
MQLIFRGLRTHALECQESDSIGSLKTQIAALEGIQASEISLFISGAPVSDEALAQELGESDLELSVGLPGGKVHGSLARAGKVKGQTPKVEKQEKKKKKTGLAKRRIQYNRRFVNVVASFGRRRGPNSNSGQAT